MIQVAIDRGYSDFDLFVQQQLLNEKIVSCRSKIVGNILIAECTIRRPQFSTGYRIQVLYHSQDLHGVWIGNTEIHPSMAIHMYSDRSLCLYYPPDISPYRRIWVASDLIPMAVLWVHQYERWLFNGHNWKGWEAPGHWFLMQQLQYRDTRMREHLRSLIDNRGCLDGDTVDGSVTPH